MDKKYYKAGTCAEGSRYFTVELSKTELEAVKKFVDASNNNIVYDEGYSGDFWIDDANPYNTQEDAVEAFKSFSDFADN